MKHYLKSWKEFFLEIRKGNKVHELRRNDREFKIGDTLVLQEWDKDSEEYTGNEIEAEVTYITNPTVPCALSNDALNHDFCILSIRPIYLIEVISEE